MKKKMEGFYKDKFPGLFNGENSRQLINVYKLLEYYGCTLDVLINIMERYFNCANNEVISNSAPSADELNREIYKTVTGEESDVFIDFKINKCFLCLKAVKLLLSFDWMDKNILDLDDKSDIDKIQNLINYFEKNKYSNGIQHYIDCRKK